MSEMQAAAPPAPGPAGGAYLAGLNDAQRAAVEALDGPVLVLAGAGTGKTRALTTRLAHLLATRDVRPWNVLAVTFTNKAAREMRDRVAAIIGPASAQVWLGTFHALGARFLRRHAELVGLRPNFTILDADDQERLLKQLLQAEGIDAKRWPARLLLSAIQRWKDRGLGPDRIGAGDAGDLAAGKLPLLYRLYQERLTVLNAVDFGDLLLHCLTLFQAHPDVLARYQDQFSHLLVDEYQDANVAQYLWLRLLARPRGNICCVGDDDQSIYGWRGAEVGNILRFETDFPGARVIRLEQNYRSTGHILAAASGLIAHNEGRLGKTLWTGGEEGGKLLVRAVWDGEDEARMVGEAIETYRRRRTPYAEMAVLVRAGFQTRAFEERLLKLGIPYRVIGGLRFYERQEIRDAIAYLRVIHQPDDDLAFERIVNRPRRGIGPATLQEVQRQARTERCSLTMAAAELVRSEALKPLARRRLAGILEDFTRWRAMADRLTPAELCGTVLDESGYVDMWRNDRSLEAPGRLENLKELVGAVEEFDGLAGFLEHVGLVMENAEAGDGDQVSLMTLHAAKGLEYDILFLPGWEEGLFPNARAMDSEGRAGLEEERRLAYVGLTRARRAVEISFAASRQIHGSWQAALPSRFIGELPADHVELLSESGLHRGGWMVAADGAAGYAPSRRQEAGGGGRGPGYGRRGGLLASPPPARDREGYHVERARPSRFAVDDRVFHQKFGMGTVRQVDGDKLDIAFDKAGDRKVVASFVSAPP